MPSPSFFACFLVRQKRRRWKNARRRKEEGVYVSFSFFFLPSSPSFLWGRGRRSTRPGCRFCGESDNRDRGKAHCPAGRCDPFSTLARSRVSRWHRTVALRGKRHPAVGCNGPAHVANTVTSEARPRWHPSVRRCMPTYSFFGTDQWRRRQREPKGSGPLWCFLLPSHPHIRQPTATHIRTGTLQYTSTFGFLARFPRPHHHPYLACVTRSTTASTSPTPSFTAPASTFVFIASSPSSVCVRCSS